MSTSLLSLPAASLLVSLIGAEAALVTSGPGTEAGGGITGPDITTGGLGIETERPSTINPLDRLIVNIKLVIAQCESKLTWHHRPGRGRAWLTLAVYDGFSRQRRLALTCGGARGPTLALDLATSRRRGLGGEAGHGWKHWRLDVEHLDVIVTLDQPLLWLYRWHNGRGEAVTNNHPLKWRP